MGALRPKQLARLCTLGFKKLAGFRKTRLSLLRQYVGRFYEQQNSEAAKSAPVNLIFQAATTMVPNLVYENPKAAVSTNTLAYRPYAQILELALNHAVKEIKLRQSLRKVITDSLFLAGFMKVGLAVTGQTLDIDGVFHDLGQPYADRVDPDDMLLDPLAREWEEQKVIGNRFRIESQALIEAGYDAKVVAALSSRYSQSKTGLEASWLSAGRHSTMTEADSVIDEIDLVEVWVPDEGLIKIMPWSPEGEVEPDVLREVPYNGPEGGPYIMLGYAQVPDNIIPVAPAMVWNDLHIMANRVARRIGRQAERQKRILAYEPGAWEDTQELLDSDDGDAVKVSDVNAIKEITLGGTTEDAYVYMEWAKKHFAEMAMNIDLLSGAGSDEDTATQAEMVQANTTIRLSDMQSQVYQFTAEAMERLGYFLHTDPLIELPLIKRTEGVDEQVVYSPEQREGDWLDYNIRVRPFSMARHDPNVKVRRLLELCGNVIPALANSFQMLGPAFNLEGTLNLIGREMGIEELDEIINSPMLHQQIGRMRELLEAGIPMDPKVIKAIMGGTGDTGTTAVGNGGRPEQPNPSGTMQEGQTPQTEANQMRHETEGELQAAYLG